jgi:hypothetical protein
MLYGMEVILLLAGFMFTGLGLLIAKAAGLNFSGAQRVDGEIIGYVQRNDPDGQTTYAPVIAYTHPAGGRRVFESSISTGSFNYPVGSKVTMLTDLQDPSRARLDTNAFVYFGLLVAAIGLGYIAFFIHFFRPSPASTACALLITAAFVVQLSMRGAEVAKIREAWNLASRSLAGSSVEEKSFDRSRLLPAEAIAAEGRRQARYSKIAGVVLLLLAAGGVAGSVFWVGRRLAFVERASPAEGRVVELAANHSHDGTTWAPVVEFTPLHASTPVRFRDSFASNPPMWSVGDHVSVLYNPLNPSDALIHRGAWTYLIPLFPAALGLFFGLCAFATFKNGLSSG